MERVGVIRCALAAVLFGASAPAASRLAGSMSSLALAGLLYLGAAIWVSPSVVRHRPTPRALRLEWRSVTVAVVMGGAVGPALLIGGLARTDAATASLLLNTELTATVVLAGWVMHEHLGARVWFGAMLVTAAGILLVYEPGASVDIGAVMVVAACACWGLDNVVTARIQQLSPEHVVALKGVFAGGANLVLGLVVGSENNGLMSADAALGAWLAVVAALSIGAIGYGWSMTLWVRGARDLGAARGQVTFASAPFIGTIIAWSVFGEHVATVQVAALVIAAVGVGASFGSGHDHEHRHHELCHDHEHRHDDGHHHHTHAERAADHRHSHPHRHEPAVHRHHHVPDLHHDHEHHQ